MSYFIKKKDLSISEQVACLKSRYPNFVTTNNHLSLKATGHLQPTARSIEYKIELRYKLGTRPEVSVLSPKLEKNFNGEAIPHIYPGEKLCLYLPGANQFNYTDLLALTIVIGKQQCSVFGN